MNHDSLMRAAPVSFSFTSQLANLKNTLSLWEDVASKTMKLSAALRTVIQCIAGFLEAFQKVADSAYGSNCGLRELGSCMTRFCLRERGLESRLRTFNRIKLIPIQTAQSSCSFSAHLYTSPHSPPSVFTRARCPTRLACSQLMECLAQPLFDRLEEWRRTVAQLERENNKEWRRARSELQRVTSEVDKLNKRFRRKGSSTSAHGDCGPTDTPLSPGEAQTGENVQLNFVQHDLAVKRRTLAELERANLRRAVVEERRRFAELITCLKPVLDSQTAIFNDVGPIDECIAAISKHVCDPNDLPIDTEQAVEEAADQVSASRERKLSNVRSVMRFGKAGTVGNFDSVGLRRIPGHCSQLSLQSSVSASNSTWNSAASSMGTTGPRPGRHCPSSLDVCSSVDGGDPKIYPQSVSPSFSSLTPERKFAHLML
ncbi:Metastasis suppressor protein 1 [Fasciolopsis buskii]|uniref:Metastasis suppressor protein 1 n=1 Tax=Fasciolopsis buskii TaxID=27845 RepID=A0A8E0VL38_9TREM|nr:Metastasis suppressor protein 1 [Fasciolopsis buski]